VLVDTATHEHLAVPTEAADAIAWVVLGAADPPLRPPSFYRQRKEQADTALTHLRAHGFPALQAFRDLAHRDLERARRALPEALQPIARHLVTENRRVQRHVAVLRRGDWQMVGGLLRMSHASLRTHWGSTPPIADALAAATESPAMDGLYGACMTERDGAVLVVGRPGTLADDVPRLHEVVAAQHGRPLRVLRPV
jgi:galactokinase